MKRKILTLTIGLLLSANAFSEKRFVSVVQCDNVINFWIDGVSCVDSKTTSSLPKYTPSTEPWFTFAQSNGQLSSSSDITGYENHTVIFSGLGIDDSNRPQKNIGHNVVYKIDFENNSLTNLDFFENVDTLVTDLVFNNNNLNDISGLSDLVNTNGAMSDLYFNNNSITSLVGLENISVLNGLHLENNNISDLTPIKNLSFDQIYLGNNNLTDISLLNIDSNTRWVELQNNNISDISVFSGFNNYTIIDLSNNNISDFSPLSSYTSVGNLTLSGNPANNLSGLENLETVSSLYIQFMPNLTNLDELSNLKSIQGFLSVSGNPLLTDISGLRNITETKVGSISLDDVSQYTVTLNETDPFCIGFKNGDITIHDVLYADICFNGTTPPTSTDPWVLFFNDTGNNSFANDDFTGEHIILTLDTDMINLELNIGDIDSNIPTENFPITYSDNNIIVDGTTHVNYMTTLTEVNQLEIGSQVVDITGLENINYVYQDIFFNDYTTITQKANLASDFCTGLDSGDVVAYGGGYSISHKLNSTHLCQ